MLRRAASQNRARRARASSRRAPPSTSPSAVAEKFNTAVPPQARREVRHSRRSPCLPARLSLLLQRLWYRVYVYQNLHMPPPFVAHDVQPATCTLVIYLSFSPSILLSLFPSLSLSLSRSLSRSLSLSLALYTHACTILHTHTHTHTHRPVYALSLRSLSLLLPFSLSRSSNLSLSLYTHA